jgi:GTP-binding protein HflX
LDRAGAGRPAAGTAAFVLHPDLKTVPASAEAGAASRTPQARLEEAEGLALALGLDVRGARVVPLARPKAGTLFGSGKVEELADEIREREIELVIVDGPVSPIQQRNLERAWKTKVLDRTGLILEIFSARARTREGRLQVELAHLTYQRTRLVRSWTHLERQRGALGFVGGPGETQKETDRRLIDERIVRIKRELETVTRTRALHRASRAKVPYPVVALVGYTNAGKSTLFNRLADAAVTAEDKLFATLDPTMRLVRLPGGRPVILSDTVGFISDLPTQLVAAFRATLEEVTEADLLIHVHDAASAEADAEAADVESVLAELGLAGEGAPPVLHAFNKRDLVPAELREGLDSEAARKGGAAISALTGEGLTLLLEKIDGILSADMAVLDLDLALEDGESAAWLYAHAEILDRQESDERLRLRVRLAEKELGRFRKRFAEAGRAQILGLAAD